MCAPPAENLRPKFSNAGEAAGNPGRSATRGAHCRIEAGFDAQRAARFEFFNQLGLDQQFVATALDNVELIVHGYQWMSCGVAIVVVVVVVMVVAVAVVLLLAWLTMAANLRANAVLLSLQRSPVATNITLLKARF